MTHTPGPWIASEPFEDEYGIEAVVIGEGPDVDGATFHEDMIATVTSMNKSEAEFKANISLIAAAPDLLEAASRLFKWFDKSGSAVNARWDRIPAEERAAIVSDFRAAIAKAMGEV